MAIRQTMLRARAERRRSCRATASATQTTAVLVSKADASSPRFGFWVRKRSKSSNQMFMIHVPPQ